MKRHLGFSNADNFIRWLSSVAGYLSKEEKSTLVSCKLAVQKANRSRHAKPKQFTGVKKLLKSSQTLELQVVLILS